MSRESALARVIGLTKSLSPLGHGGHLVPIKGSVDTEPTDAVVEAASADQGHAVGVGRAPRWQQLGDALHLCRHVLKDRDGVVLSSRALQPAEVGRNWWLGNAPYSPSSVGGRGHPNVPSTNRPFRSAPPAGSCNLVPGRSV